MVRAFRSGDALAKLILGMEWREDVLSSMLLTQQRLERLQIAVKNIVDANERAETIALPRSTKL